MYILHYRVTGERRKAQVRAVSEILGEDAVYLGAPSFSYRVGSCVIDKDGTLILPIPISPEANALREKLQARGFMAVNEPEELTVGMPREGFSEEDYSKLQMIVRSKEKLLKKALGTDSLEIKVLEDRLLFPWFTLHGVRGETHAYVCLVTALCRMAKSLSRVTAKEREIDNEKFAFRLFLIRLGFVGEQHKVTRKILLKNLSGNSSWKSGHPPVRETQNEGGAPYGK